MAFNPSKDLERLKSEYQHRETRLAGSDKYSVFNIANLFMMQQRERTTLSVLKKHGFCPIQNNSMLEVGSGSGSALFEYAYYGMYPDHLSGIDLLPNRVKESRIRQPLFHVACADAQNVPFSSQSFDLVIQYTVFSSILDGVIKNNIATEMLRVLKPDGMILWYDFWWNPINRQTQGIRPPEIRKLFPGCTYEFHQVTLAPPIARKIVPVSWVLALLLEKIVIFNSHYLVAIRPFPRPIIA